MREDLYKLKRLRDTLIGLEMDISVTENELIILNRDLHYMEIAESTLCENLKILKKEKVIAMASQYKKTVNELEYIGEKIKTYREHINRLENNLQKLLNKHNIYMTDYKAQKKVVDNQKVILYFDPKKRKKSEG